MLNPELKKDIDVEINKSDKKIADFLRSDYFRETMDLIFRVNRLNIPQSEGVELEVILSVLRLSDYDNLPTTLTVECGIENQSTLNQIIHDLNIYIFDKTKTLYEDTLNDQALNLQINANTGHSVEESNESRSKTEELGINMISSVRSITDPRELVNRPENITLTPKEKTELKEEIKKELEIKPLGDVYLERIDEEENVIKKEF